MSSSSTDARRPGTASLQYFFWLHPEWWSVALCGLAWAVMVVRGWPQAGHEVHHRVEYALELQHWLLMVAAMMLPFSLDSLRVTAERSFWARRHRAMAGFLAGYFAPWLAVGIVVAGVREGAWAHTHAATALCFAAAALWQRTPIHKRALTACHRRRPLAPFGWRADRDCLRFGATIGNACVRSCWPLMLACAFAGHDLIAMTGGMVVGALERWSFRPRRRAVLMGTLVLVGYYMALTALSWTQQPSPTH